MSMRRLVVPLAAALVMSAPAVASAVNADNVQELIAEPESRLSVDNMLDELPEVGQMVDRFDPEDFSEWVDYNNSGCLTPTDILYYALPSAVRDGCDIKSGQLIDPYSGQSKWLNNPDDVIKGVALDHIVSPEQAWRAGAWSWPEDKRAAFYNDPMNITVVFPETAADRAGSGADSWLPDMDPSKYANLQIRVKHKYGLGVSASERVALASAAGIDPPETHQSDEQDDTMTSTPSSTPSSTPGDTQDENTDSKVGPIVDTGGQVAPNWFTSFKSFLSKLTSS